MTDVLDLIDTHVTPDGVKRALGLYATGSYPAVFRPVAPAATTSPVIPREELTAYESWPAALVPLDQESWNACTYFSSAQALMYARFESGQPHVALDPLHPYLAETAGRNTGTNILLAALRLARFGCPPLGTAPNSKTTQALRFRLQLTESLTSYEQLLSEVARRRPVVGSVFVGRTYSRLDAEGAMGVSRGTANHAIYLGGGLKFSRVHGWMIKHCGSWGPNWGQGGFGWYTEAHFDASGHGEAYTVEAVREDPADTENPPPVESIAA